MADVRIDTSRLTFTQFVIPESPTGVFDGATMPIVPLAPGVYHLVQASGVFASFTFTVTTAGRIDFDPAHDAFLEGRGTTTLIVRGVTFELDGRALSHDLLPMIIGATILTRDRVHTLTLMPANNYGVQPGGTIADFHFDLGVDGRVSVPERFAGFARTDGRTLTIDGYRITLDARPLSHGLNPISLLGNADTLSNDRTHDLTYMPAPGYGFQPGSFLADFSFDIDVLGNLIVPDRFRGFARAEGRTLIIDGYRLTIDGRQLSHALMPLSLHGFAPVLANDRVHEVTYLPGGGYGFQPGGTIADFAFDLDVNGQLGIDPRFERFATIVGRTIVITGFRVGIDGRALPHDLMPVALLGDVGERILPRDRVHHLTLIPAPTYMFADLGHPVSVTLALRIDGSIEPQDVPGGLIVTRWLPAPPGLRGLFADLFLPPRGSVREFCKAKNVRSLRAAIRAHRDGTLNGVSIRDNALAQIDALFDGGTDEEDEDRALAILLGSTRMEDLTFLVNKLTWDGLDDDLDEGDLNQIMDRLKVLMDKRQYLGGFLLRYYFLDDDEILPTVDFVNVLTPYATSRSPEVRQAFAEQALNQKNALLDGIMLMALRNRATGLRELRLAIDRAAGPEQYRATELQRLSWEVFYTEQIGAQLARGEYKLLQQTLTDLFNATFAPPAFSVRNIALFNMLRRWDRAFVAMERAINILGSERQKADVRRYMDTRRLFMDNFPTVPPTPPAAFLAALQQAVQAITTTLSGVAGSFADLVGAVQAIATDIGDLSAPAILGTADDDKAVAATNTLSAEGLLAVLPSRYKIELNTKMLDGAVVDADEEGILTVLRDAKTRSPAEFLQVASSATWAELDGSFDGTQHDALEALFKF
jgi:hypothetical protein